MASRWFDFDRFLGWDELDRTVSMLDQFRRRANALLDDPSQANHPQLSGWPRTNLYDSGAELLVTAEVPGLSEKDIEVSINQDVLTVSGERKVNAPEGYAVHRRERVPVKFSRSFSLPYKVQSELCSASVQNGILTVHLAKAPEAQPRQITIKGA